MYSAAFCLKPLIFYILFSVPAHVGNLFCGIFQIVVVEFLVKITSVCLLVVIRVAVCSSGIVSALYWI